jgi:hypothetical protein
MSKKKPTASEKKRPEKSPPPEFSRPPKPVMGFTPTAWAKLWFFCHHGATEVGGFGITSAEDLLLVEDFVTVKQDASLASISFHDEAVADFFEMQVDAGRKPEEFARIWLHTHPGNCPQPSQTDEETFYRVFGRCEWAVMFVLARGGKSYARLRFNAGPGGELVIPVEVDYSKPFPASDHGAWQAEYAANIQQESFGIWDDRKLVAAVQEQEDYWDGVFAECFDEEDELGF